MEQLETFDIMAMAKRVNRQVKARRVAQMLGGGALVAAGIVRRSWSAPVLMLSGAALIVRGATGRPLDDTLRLWWRKASAPQTHRLAGNKRDKVDEASWQSFPASDPPGHSPG